MNESILSKKKYGSILLFFYLKTLTEKKLNGPAPVIGEKIGLNGPR